MKLLVLGGSEFVSQSLAKYLISKGYSVDILTRGTKGLSYSGYNKHIKCDRKDALLFGRSGSQLQSNPFLCKKTNEFDAATA